MVLHQWFLAGEAPLYQSSPSLLLITIMISGATFLAAFFYPALARRWGAEAAVNPRSAHSVPTPTAAGVVLLFVLPLGFFILGVAPAIWSAFAAVWLCGVVGFVDDIKPLSAGVRIPVYFLSAFWIALQSDVFLPHGVTGFSSLALCVVLALGISWSHNLYNFMDGIDGLAIAEFVFVAGSVLVLALVEGGDQIVTPATVLVAAAVGLLPLNWPRARYFIGDAGSAILGLALGVLATAGSVSVWVWLILFGWFVTDATLTLLIRLMRRENVLTAHSTHAYQHLARRYGGTRTLLGILTVNALWLLPVALLAHHHPALAPALLTCAFAPMLIYQFRSGAGRPRVEGQAIDV